MPSHDHCVVYVHGISEHAVGYSDLWHAALSPHLGHEMKKSEVYWSDLVNTPRASIPLNEDGMSDEAIGLREALDAELELRKQRNGQDPSEESGERASARSFAFDDFLRYMLSESTRNEILARFEAVVAPLLARGERLHVIAHSWGSVVAYEALRRLDSPPTVGRVANLFSLGAALSIDVVQRNLFRRLTDGRQPQIVQTFINLHAGGDIIGRRLGPELATTREHLGLPPVGCATIPGRPETALNFACAHRSYFRNENHAVQRDILARGILAAIS